MAKSTATPKRPIRTKLPRATDSNGAGGKFKAISVVNLDEIQMQPIAGQFLTFAEAYMDTASRQCEHLARNPGQFNYAHGAAVMFLIFHGIELFLKAAILQRAPGEQFKGPAGHDLDALLTRYSSLYQSSEHALGIPWSLEAPDYGARYDARLAEELRARDRAMPRDQMNRYPTDRNSKAWRGVFGFEPISCLRDISRTQVEFERLKPLLFPHT